MATTFAGYVSAAFTVPAGETIIVTTNSGGPTNVDAPAGSYDSIDSFLTAFVAALTAARPVTAGAWTITNTLANAGATPTLTIAVTAGTFTITWTSTNLRNLLGFAGTAITAQTSATGTVSVVGVWQPDCPLTTMKRHRSAPLKTDMRQSRTPTGIVYANIGNERYQHDDVRWSHVPTNKVWRVDEAVTGESLEQWLDDTQLSRGHAWFSVGSKCKLIAHDGNLVGGFDGIDNWWPTGFTGINDIVTDRATEGWDGHWSVRFPAIESDGS